MLLPNASDCKHIAVLAYVTKRQRQRFGRGEYVSCSNLSITGTFPGAFRVKRSGGTKNLVLWRVLKCCAFNLQKHVCKLC
jgi:hypothetical protein